MPQVGVPTSCKLYTVRTDSVSFESEHVPVLPTMPPASDEQATTYGLDLILVKGYEFLLAHGYLDDNHV